MCSRPVQSLGHRAGGSGTSVLLLLEGMCRGACINGPHTMLAFFFFFFLGRGIFPVKRLLGFGAQAGALATVMALFPTLRLVAWS